MKKHPLNPEAPKFSKHAKLYAVLCWLGGCCLSAYGGDSYVANTSADIVLADFEGGTYGKWTIEGDAFEGGSLQRDPDDQDQRLHGSMHGDACASSRIKGDWRSGTLTSPPFTIDRDYLTFLIGGGVHKGTRVELIVDNKPVKDCSGIENIILKANYFDVSKWRGKTAQLRLVDEVEATWGHIVADHFVLTNEKPDAAAWDQQERTFKVTKDHLIIPISNLSRELDRKYRDSKDWLEIKGSPVQLLVGTNAVRHYWARVATSEEDADWYASLSLEEFKRKEVTLRSWRAADEGFALLKQSDTIPGEEMFHKEAFRPKFHFTQKTGFNNDPNGMVYHKGLWHYFWQHNPVKRRMGNQTWGHATSPDLLHWTQHPGKLFPFTNGDGAMFSGSGTVDKKNTSGFGKDAIVLFFTNTRIGECIAYSTDKGKTFVRYEDNPIITFDQNNASGKLHHRGRDPKVIWYEYDKDDTPLNDTAKKLGGHWVMLVFDETEGKERRGGAFYTSVDMKNWERQSLLLGYYECMELFELPVDPSSPEGYAGTSGNEKDKRWVVYSGDARYAIGDFNGKVFTPEHEGKYRLHHGTYYASQTFDNPPDGRKIQVGWNTSRAADEAPYAGHHSFPHQLTLHREPEGIRMRANPIEEIERLRVKSHRIENVEFSEEKPVTLPFTSDTFDLTVEFEPGDTEEVFLRIPGTHILYKTKEQIIDHREIPLKIIDGKVKIRVLVDVCLYEIAGNDGRIYASLPRDYKQKISEIAVTARGGTAKLTNLEVHELKSTWEK